MSENAEARLDSALTTMVTAYTDSAPDVPDINKILVTRAGRPAAAPAADRRWLRPAVAGVFGLVVLVGGFAAIRAASDSGNGGQTIVPADPTETADENSEFDGDGADGSGDQNSDETDGEGTTNPDGAADDGSSDDGTSDDANQAGTPTADLGALAGAETAGDLPDEAPSTFWVVGGDSADLMQIEARTGRILANAEGWGPQELGEGDRGQALQRAEISPDGTVYVDDCCEPAFGSVFQLAPGEVFEPGRSAWQQGLYPEVSPSGEKVMLAVGGSLQIVTDTGAAVASIGDPEGSFEGIRFVPLAWIDEWTIAVRVFDDIEEIRFYDLGLDDGELTERAEARRVVADRFYLDAAARADGKLVVAARRPNGDSLGLAGGGDLVGEVVDPTTGALVSEFDLPDLIFEIDYDITGRFLITSGDDGIIRWFGFGLSGILAEGALSASWN